MSGINSMNRTNSSNNVHASVSMSTLIATPVLRSVDPAKAAKFLKEREWYELKIKFKQSEIPLLKILSNKANINHQL